jgi:dCMP deaminase
MSVADVSIVNQFASEAELRQEVDRLDLLNPVKFRPSWDLYFMRLADLASKRTNCMKRAVGAVIVRENRVIATGYNGTPRGTTNCNTGGCPRCNGGARRGEKLDECLCMHAEANAIVEAGGSRGATLYTNLCPCLPCMKLIVQAGVREVVYRAMYAMDDQSRALAREAGVAMRQIS